MPESQSPTSARAQSPGLLRQLGFFSATALVVSNMVGAAIFGTTGLMAGDLGSVTLILACWAAGAVCAIAGALCYSELGMNLPSSGGEYVYLTRAFGPEWGFMTGWVSFFAGFSAPIAAAALIFSDYLGHFWPNLRHENTPVVIGSGLFSLHIGPGQAVASLLIAACTILNCFGLGRSAKVQNVLTSIKLIVIGGLVFGAFFFRSPDSGASWSNFSQHAVRTSSHGLPMQFIISLIWVFFGYSGWNSATYVAEEIRRPERTLPLALAVGSSLVAMLYLALNVVYIYSTPLETMKNQIAVGDLAASRLFGPGVASVFTGLLAVCIVSTVNAMVTVGPRVYYAMAKNKAFFGAAAKVNPRFHTPVIAILSQGLCATLMTLTPFRDLLFYIGISLTFFSALAVASLFVFRAKQPGWQRLPAVQFAYPLIPALYIMVGIAIMIFGVIGTPIASLAAFATVGAGALVYHFTIRPQRP
jgi:basic amino acid/polyamine antiporter, APA family